MWQGTLRSRRLTILLVEDCEDDILITQRALREAEGEVHQLHAVRDGVEALDYLRSRGAYALPGKAPRPDIILLDVNMPRLDGFGLLRETKQDDALRLIPVIMLSTSTAEWDIRRAYELGANTYVVKPESYRRTVEVIRTLCEYWGGVGELA